MTHLTFWRSRMNTFDIEVKLAQTRLNPPLVIDGDKCWLYDRNNEIRVWSTPKTGTKNWLGEVE